jgi:hypothetical protein
MTEVVRRHAWFAGALLLGVLLRVAVQVAFPPAFIFSDGPTYLALAHVLAPSPDRTIGYSVLLRVVSWATPDVWAVAVLQHLLGLLTAVVAYALLRRWGVGGPVATLATLPLLLDTMELVLEHSVMSDVLFDLLLVLATAVLAWRRRPPVLAFAGGGALLALAVLVRVVGEPTVLAALVFCLAVVTTVRGRLLSSAALLAAFVVPLAGYAAWYHAHEGAWALSQAGGRALYMRSTTFVDCARIDVPAYERTLCPPEPLGQRRDPTDYGWHRTDTVQALVLPPGVSLDAALGQFGRAAIQAQPGDYVHDAVRDFLMNFYPLRLDYFEYDTAYKWSFHHYVDYQPTTWTGPAYATYGGEQPISRHPLADVLEVYGFVVYLWGPLLLVALLLALVGLVWRRDDAPPTRPLIFLTTAVGAGLMLVPALTAEFTWRYQLPAVVFLPLGAALAWTRLTGRRSAQEGTTATPSTD